MIEKVTGSLERQQADIDTKDAIEPRVVDFIRVLEGLPREDALDLLLAQSDRLWWVTVSAVPRVARPEHQVKLMYIQLFVGAAWKLSADERKELLAFYKAQSRNPRKVPPLSRPAAEPLFAVLEAMQVKPQSPGFYGLVSLDALGRACPEMRPEVKRLKRERDKRWFRPSRRKFVRYSFRRLPFMLAVGLFVALAATLLAPLGSGTKLVPLLGGYGLAFYLYVAAYRHSELRPGKNVWRFSLPMLLLLGTVGGFPIVVGHYLSSPNLGRLELTQGNWGYANIAITATNFLILFAILGFSLRTGARMRTPSFWKTDASVVGEPSR